MYAQTAIKHNIIPRNYAYGIVMRGVQNLHTPCTCSDASLGCRSLRKKHCITIRTATEESVSYLIQALPTEMQVFFYAQKQGCSLKCV